MFDRDVKCSGPSLSVNALEEVALFYPKINLAIGYEVDPNWPQRHQGLAWGEMPGVAIDAQASHISATATTGELDV